MQTAVQLAKHVEELKDAHVKLAAAKKAEEMLKEQEKEMGTLQKMVEDIAQEKKRIEAGHRDTVMDLNGKVNEKEALLQQARQVQEKMKEREKQLIADIQTNLKTNQTLDAELNNKIERYNLLKKHSQELAIQIDNVKISKEQQALKNKEQIKAAAELEA